MQPVPWAHVSGSGPVHNYALDGGRLVFACHPTFFPWAIEFCRREYVFSGENHRELPFKTLMWFTLYQTHIYMWAYAGLWYWTVRPTALRSRFTDWHTDAMHVATFVVFVDNQAFLHIVFCDIKIFHDAVQSQLLSVMPDFIFVEYCVWYLLLNIFHSCCVTNTFAFVK